VTVIGRRLSGGRLSGGQRQFLTGTLWVAAGILILGISGYGFLTLAAGRVGAVGYASLSSLYLLVALAGPGLFFPIEQETTRLVSRARALEFGDGEYVRQLAVISAALFGLALLLLIGVGSLLVTRVFHGHLGLWFALTGSVAGYAGVSVLRGILAGRGHLRAYGVVVGTDGLTRLLPCLAFAVAGVTATLPYGLAVGAGSIASFAVAVLLTRPRRVLSGQGPRAEWSDLIPDTASLVAASAIALSVANVAPVIVNALLPNDPGRAGVFAFVFVLARVPLFLMYGMQPVLLPVLSESSARHQHGALSRDVRRALVVVGVLGAGALALTVPVCRWLADALFPGRAEVSGLIIEMLAVGTILAMLVQAVQPALIAVSSHRMVAGAWLLGLVCFAAAFALPLEPVAAASVAQIAAGAATLSAMTVALRRHLRTAKGPAS
jgi:O-antigen/teichoic acid export membrane protein